MNIQKEVRDKIVDRSNAMLEESKKKGWPIDVASNYSLRFEEGASLGYSLPLQTIDEKEREIARYKRLFDLATQFKTHAEKEAYKNRIAANTVDSERDANSILTEELQVKDAEIKRLQEEIKGLQEYMSNGEKDIDTWNSTII